MHRRIAICLLPPVLLLMALGRAELAGGEAPRNYAVVIGINGYDASLGRLEYCVADAKAVRDQLVRGGLFPARNVVLMTDDAAEPQDRPTFARLSRRLQNLREQADGIDTLLVFFSGHGLSGEGGTDYLIPVDGSRDFGLAVADVRRWLADARAKRTVLILDCCRPGRGTKGVVGLVPESAAGTEVLLFASCAADQTSHEDKGSGHGVFSAYLAAGLSGKADVDGDLTVTGGELFGYVREGVQGWAYRQNVAQTPVLLPESGGLDMPLARIPETPEIDVPEIKLPEEALPDITVPGAEGTALERFGKIEKLLEQTRADIVEKSEWYDGSSVQMRALKAQEAALVGQMEEAAMQAARVLNAELAAIDSAMAEGERRGWKLAHPEMRKLTEARYALLLSIKPLSDCLSLPQQLAVGLSQGVLRGHTDVVYSVAFSPDGRLLASGSWDKTVRLWDVSTGQELRSLTGHTGGVYPVAFSPGGRLLASGSSDSTVRLWDVSRGREVRTLTGHRDKVSSLAFSPDGRLLATGSTDTKLFVWDVSTGEPVRFLPGDKRVWAVAISPGGGLLARGTDCPLQRETPDSDICSIHVWYASTGRELWSRWTGAWTVTSVAFSPDGRLLASGLLSGYISLWNALTGEKVRSFGGQGYSVEMAFSPDSRLLATGSDDKMVHLWDVSTGDKIRSLVGHTGQVNSVAFSPDGRLLASASGDKTVRLWAVSDVVGTLPIPALAGEEEDQQHGGSTQGLQQETAVGAPSSAAEAKDQDREKRAEELYRQAVAARNRGDREEVRRLLLELKRYSDTDSYKSHE